MLLPSPVIISLILLLLASNGSAADSKDNGKRKRNDSPIELQQSSSASQGLRHRGGPQPSHHENEPEHQPALPLLHESPPRRVPKHQFDLNFSPEHQPEIISCSSEETISGIVRPRSGKIAAVPSDDEYEDIESDPIISTIPTTEAKGKAAAAVHYPNETMGNSQGPHGVASDSELDPKLTDDKLQKYFIYYRAESKEGQKGKCMAKCRICGRELSRKDSYTTGLTRHLKLHKQFWKIYDDAKQQIELEKQQKKAPDGTVSIDPEEYGKLKNEKPDDSLEKYFEYYMTEGIGGEKGQQKARCRICEKELTRTQGSTTSMTGHLMRLHKEFYDIYDAERKKNISQQTRPLQVASSAVSFDPEEYEKLNTAMPEYSWERYFDYFDTEGIDEEKGKQKARCRICEKELTRNGGSTTSMRDHLTRRHKEFYNIFEAANHKFTSQNKRLWKGASSASMDLAQYNKLDVRMARYALQKYFDYKNVDKTAKCLICNKQIEKTQGSTKSLTDHLKQPGQHEEYFKMYEMAKQKMKFDRQEKRLSGGDDGKVGKGDDEENGDEEEPNTSQLQYQQKKEQRVMVSTSAKTSRAADITSTNSAIAGAVSDQKKKKKQKVGEHH